MRVVHWLFAACLFTASFDTFLTFDLGGTVRFAQIVTIAIFLAAVARIAQDGRILWPRGGSALALWIGLQALFIRFSGNLALGVEFFVLMLSMALIIYAVTQLWGLYGRIEDLMRVYLASYCAMAMYGIFQFFLPLLTGSAPPGIRQWYVHGRVPRVTGFSFEPSYYATYMILGWIMLVDLRFSGARIAQGRWMKRMTLVATIAMLVCSSRVGWICMLLEGLLRVLPPLRRRIARQWQGITHGYVLLRIPSRRTLLWAAVLFGSLGALVVTAIRFLPDPTIILAGTGLAGTPSHSVHERANGTAETWNVIKESPWLGRSLGGVPVAIAAVKGIELHSVADVRYHWGFPVLLDVLAASGVFGVIPFLVFLWSTTFGAWRYAVRHISDERAKWLRALARATIFIWIMLFEDQNLLRLYLWFHFAMVMVIRYNLEFAPVPVLAENPPHPAPQLGYSGEVPAL